jgi:hypothetical protein
MALTVISTSRSFFTQLANGLWEVDQGLFNVTFGAFCLKLKETPLGIN